MHLASAVWGPSNGRQSSMDSNNMSPSHRKQFSVKCYNVHHFLIGVLQKQPAPAWVPHRVTSPIRKTAPSWVPLFMGPQVPAWAFHGLPHGLQMDLSVLVVLHGLQGPQHPGDPPWVAGAQLLLHGLHLRVQVNLSSGAWSTSFPFFCTDLVVHGVVPLTYSHFSLFWLQLQLCGNFFLCLLKCVLTEALAPLVAHPSWSCLALAVLNMEEAPNSFSQK